MSQEIAINETMDAGGIYSEAQRVELVLHFLDNVLGDSGSNFDLELSIPAREGLRVIFQDAKDRMTGIIESVGSLNKPVPASNAKRRMEIVRRPEAEGQAEPVN